MFYCPVFLDVKGKRVLVAGPARWRCARPAGWSKPAPWSRWRRPRRWLHSTRFRCGFSGAVSALPTSARRFSSSPRRTTAASTGGWRKRRGIPVNVADPAAECGFLAPAWIRRGVVQIAVSTGGRSPRLAAALRRRIESALNEP